MRDRDVRLAVLQKLDALHAGDADTHVVEEMGVWSGSVRVDIAVINGELQGFELKSAKDTLSRLPFQAELYSQVFDRVTLVTAQKHLDKSISIVPVWWGIYLAVSKGDGTVDIREYRAASVNPQIDPLQLSRLLWKAEAVKILEKYGLAKGYRAKSSDVMAHRLAEHVPVYALRDDVRDALKLRTNWLRQNAPSDADVPIDADCNPMP